MYRYSHEADHPPTRSDLAEDCVVCGRPFSDWPHTTCQGCRPQPCRGCGATATGGHLCWDCRRSHDTKTSVDPWIEYDRQRKEQA